MLNDFNVQRQGLMEKWKSILRYSKETGYRQLTERIENEIEKLDLNEFYLMVVGQFKRGKSTLINYLVGESVLPTGVVPITSIVTQIRYGSPPGAVVIFNDGHTEDIPLKELEYYVSEMRNPENQKDVNIIQVRFPSEKLESGLVLIDTPGIGSIFEHNTRVAHEYLPKADAAVLVISSDPPVGELEIEFLEKVRKYVDKIFIVQNKTDYLEEDEINITVNFSRKIIQDKLGCSFNIYPLSALNALTGIKEGNRDKVLKSGMPAFEEEISRFLTKEKGNVLLTSSRNKFQMTLKDLLDYIEFKINSATLPVAELEQKRKEFEEAMGELEIQRKETVHLVDNYIKYIIEDLEKHISDIVKNSIPEIYEDLREIYRANTGVRPSHMAQLLQSSLEKQIVKLYTQFNAEEKEYVREKFDILIKRFTDKFNSAIDYINGVSNQLFGFDAAKPIENVELVDRDRFYFKFSFSSTSMTLPGKIDAARLMPRGPGNRMVFNTIADRLEEQLVNNGANLKWEYICKLKDSKFIFERLFMERISVITDQTCNMIEEIIRQREEAEESISDALENWRGMEAKLLRMRD